MDMLVVLNFPSIISWEAGPFQSCGFLIASAFNMFCAFMLVVANLLVYNDDKIRLITAISAVFATGFAAITMILLQCRHLSISNVMVYFGLTVAMLMYSVGTGLELTLQPGDNTNRYKYSGDLVTAAAAIGLLSMLGASIVASQYAVTQFLSPGNFYFLAVLLGFGAFFCLFLHGLTISDEPAQNCDISCSGTETFGLIMLFFYTMLTAMFFVIQYDVVTIEEGTIVSQLQERESKVLLQDDLESSKSFDAESALFHKDSTTEVRGDVELMDEIRNLQVEFTQTDVLIIGCGPSGLTLALEVGIRNCKAIVVDMRKQVNPDSRFFNLSCATMEGLNRLDVMEDIIKRSNVPEDFGHGSTASTGFTHPDAMLFAKTPGPCRAEQQKTGHHLSYLAAGRVMGSKYAEQQPQRCMQSIQEQCLKDKAESMENLDVMYGWELLSFCELAEEERVVYAKIRNVSNSEIRFIKSKFLVGCDGPGSVVSKKVQARFDGFVNLGQMRTIHIHAPGLLAKIRPHLGDSLQYHIARPGFGVGWFVMNDISTDAWTFFLMGLVDGRPPRGLSKEEMVDVVKEFVGPGIKFTVTSDSPWYASISQYYLPVMCNIISC